MTEQAPHRLYLREDQIPTQWYNLRADMPEKPEPIRLPNGQVARPEDLASVFCDELVRQELDDDTAYVDIPEPVLEMYRIYRPSPLCRAYNLEKALGTPAKIYYKFEGNNTSGSHKLNSAIAQAYYAKAQDLDGITTETGAGQWGTALAEASAHFGLNLDVFMVKCSYEQKPFRRNIMETFDAHVTPSPSDTTEIGRKMLAEHPDSSGSLGTAISEAVERALNIPGNKGRYTLGSVLNQVVLHQSVIGLESYAAFEELGEYPDVVIGCGGYASFPVVSAAQKLGIPTVLLEVNAYPGITTKMLAKKADKVLICFEEARELVGGGDKVELTGSPVRGEIVFADRAKARQKLGLSDSDRLVVSFWGSMGAKYMNEHMAGMLALETKQGSTFRHIHATGSAAFQWLPKMACEQGAKLTGGNIEVTEYIYDMASYMAAADLVICRAGAATIGELCALGKPSIMVPSPYVAENHQEKNARALEHAGACEVLLEKDATPQTLLEMTERLLADDARWAEMSRAAAGLAQLDAGEKIYQQILSVLR